MFHFVAHPCLNFAFWPDGFFAELDWSREAFFGHESINERPGNGRCGLNSVEIEEAFFLVLRVFLSFHGRTCGLRCTCLIGRYRLAGVLADFGDQSETPYPHSLFFIEHRSRACYWC